MATTNRYCWTKRSLICLIKIWIIQFLLFHCLLSKEGSFYQRHPPNKGSCLDCTIHRFTGNRFKTHTAIISTISLVNKGKQCRNCLQHLKFKFLKIKVSHLKVGKTNLRINLNNQRLVFQCYSFHLLKV